MVGSKIAELDVERDEDSAFITGERGHEFIGPTFRTFVLDRVRIVPAGTNQVAQIRGKVLVELDPEHHAESGTRMTPSWASSAAYAIAA